MQPIITRLLASDEPSVRYKIRRHVLGESAETLVSLQEEVRASARVLSLLSEQQVDGTIPRHPYQKWQGAHWVLSLLADLGYPVGDQSLAPMRTQVYGWLLEKDGQRKRPPINGRKRVCASQDSNALYALLTLGLADEGCDRLAHNLMAWQWPDGGWNCDQKPEASHSSFHESLLPLRALALYARLRNDPEAARAAQRTAEMFLQRSLFRRLSDGSIIDDDFLNLHYPSYWYYGFLAGLKVMAEAGFIRDPRCAEALDLLESRQLPDDGFPADSKVYTMGKSAASGLSLVKWGSVGKTRINEWVSVDALYVLRAAGRLEVKHDQPDS